MVDPFAEDANGHTVMDLIRFAGIVCLLISAGYVLCFGG